jgi:hypothetical protein
MPSPLVTSTGRFDLSAIMRAAIAMCWTYRTTATGIGTASIEFQTARVFDRSRLSLALRAVWKQARRQRQTWRINQPEAVALSEALEAAKRLRWAAEAAAISAELLAASGNALAVPAPSPALPEPIRLAA